MSDDEPKAQAAGAPRVGPRGERRIRQALFGLLAGIPTLSALYGLHRGGLGGAGVGLVVSVFGAALVILPAVRLRDWLLSPRKPPLWRYERLYWSITALIAGALLIGATILLGAFDPAEEHGIDGWIDGFIAGVIVAILFVGASAGLHAWLMWLKGPATPDDSGDRSRLQQSLGPTLAELEAVRQDVGRHIRRRASWMTPLGAAVLLTAWFAYLLRGGDLDLILPPVAILVGAGLGQMIAVSKLADEYERLYKARVLPQLAALFGALTFQRPPPPDLSRLRQFHVFRHFGAAHADDAILGHYRGVALSIVQLELTRGWGPWRKHVFRGLLIEIELKNPLTGTTAVAAVAGTFGNLRDELAARNIHHVGLESPAFEREYQVYSTDQVMARALLTPDFMQRFVALGRNAGFGRPLALAQDSLLLLAMPRSDDRAGRDDYFAPPSYESPANDDDVLQRLHDDIAAVLRTADAVIGLDDATREDASSHRWRRKPA